MGLAHCPSVRSSVSDDCNKGEQLEDEEDIWAESTGVDLVSGVAAFSQS